MLPKSTVKYITPHIKPDHPKYSEEITSLFRARPKLRFIKPTKKEDPRPFGGVHNFLKKIQEITDKDTESCYLPTNEARIQRRQQRIEANEQRVAIQKANYIPHNNPNATSNPNATLFICNVPDDVTPDQVRYELQVFGKVKCIKFPVDIITGKRRNYCFAEYEKEESFRNAMLQGTKLYFHEKKMIVDKERARTVPGWYPRRLGGGIGALSRRFSHKLSVLEIMQCKRKKKYGYKCGIRYRGMMQEIRNKRDQKFGIDRNMLRQMGRKRYLNPK